MWVMNLGESIFVDMTGPFSEIIIKNRYFIGVVDDYFRYFWVLFIKTKSRLPKKMAWFLKNIYNTVLRLSI